MPRSSKAELKASPGLISVWPQITGPGGTEYHRTAQNATQSIPEHVQGKESVTPVLRESPKFQPQVATDQGVTGMCSGVIASTSLQCFDAMAVIHFTRPEPERHPFANPGLQVHTRFPPVLPRKH